MLFDEANGYKLKEKSEGDETNDGMLVVGDYTVVGKPTNHPEVVGKSLGEKDGWNECKERYRIGIDTAVGSGGIAMLSSTESGGCSFVLNGCS